MGGEDDGLLLRWKERDTHGLFFYGNCNLEWIGLKSDDDSSLSTRATSLIDSVLIQGKITVSRKCM